MSYNNYVDTDAAWRAAYDFAEPCVAIIKHANPCGIAVGADIADAHRKAHACDPTSAFGGVIATNGPVTETMADQLGDIFTEVIIAPSFEPDALETLQRKKNLRLLVAAPPFGDRRCRDASDLGRNAAAERGRLDAPGDDPATWQLAAGPAGRDADLADLAFAWRAIRAVKSNAILLASGGATVGIGMGQVNRVDSCRLAVSRAGDRAAGSVAASDAFFPFADGPGVLIDGRRAGDRRARRVDPRRRDDRRVRGGRRRAVLHRHPPLHALRNFVRRCCENWPLPGQRWSADPCARSAQAPPPPG